MRRFVNPFFSSVVVLCALAISGFAMLVLTWRGVAANARVADQIPFLVSGGFGGVALIGAAVALLAVQLRRLDEARRRAEYDALLRSSMSLLAAVRDRREES